MMMSPVERSFASAHGFVASLGSGLSRFAASKLVEPFNLRVPFVIGVVAVVRQLSVVHSVPDAGTS
jgi:ACDE family multidrug resistance protein